MSDNGKGPFLSRVRWTWLAVVAGSSTVVLAALVVFAHFTWWRVLLFGWLPLLLVELFAVVYAGREEDRRHWLSFGLVVAAGLLVSAWLAFAEGMTLWKVLLFATVPFTVLMFFVTLRVKRRVAPYRVVQVISAILLNAYILAYLQNEILYGGFFKYIPQPVLNCYGGPIAVFACPIGSAQQMIGMKTIPWLALGLFVVIGAFIGRAACAWVCPFGMWQDLLYKVKVGPRAKLKKWTSFSVIAGVAAVAALLLVVFVDLPWTKVFGFGWLPFVALLLAIVIRGKLELPRRLWVGGFLAAVGLAALVWFKFDVGFGVTVGFFAMILLGLTGRWFAAACTAVAGFLLALLGPAFSIGPLSGAVLGLAVAAVGFGLVIVLDKVAKLSLPATYLKYGLLVLVAGLASYLTVEPWFCKLCPQGTLGAGIPLVLWDPVHALRGLVGWLYWVKVGFLLLTILAAIAVKRPFCRLVCPIGAIYAPFNKGSLMRIELDTDTCTKCRICRKVCPVGIEAYENPNQLECIRCFECVWACPKSSLKIRA
jgi:polyferredoxin